ncbi:AI-2E family transporter [Haladaptatus sp. NG-WS-4]
MTEGDDPSSTTALRLLLLVVGTLTVVLVLPYFQPILLGGLMAYLVAPINDRLSRRWRATIRTVVTILITVVVVLGPLLLLVSVAVNQGVALAKTPNFPTSRLSKHTSKRYSERRPTSRPSSNRYPGTSECVVEIVGGIPAFVVETVIFLFTFYLLRDGEQFVTWVRTAAPFDPDVTTELIARTDDLLWAAVVGNVIVAGVQAILTVLGFLVIGFDDLVFLGVVTFVLSLLPVIGASFVWIPAVIYLLFVGSVPEAVGLLVYGSLIISGSENFIRPLAMQRGAHFNSGLLILGIFGGVTIFGFLGLLVGPVLIGLSKEIVDLLVKERGELSRSG